MLQDAHSETTKSSEVDTEHGMKIVHFYAHTVYLKETFYTSMK